MLLHGESPRQCSERYNGNVNVIQIRTIEPDWVLIIVEGGGLFECACGLSL